jgi:pilus assembly protein Flp/PilA
MKSIGHAVWNFLKSEDGPTAVEYAIMTSSIIIVCYLAVAAIGVNANAIFLEIETKMP